MLTLIKRLVLGHKITPAQEDQNMTDIENAINGFEAELAVSLNPDGTLKNNSVSANALQSRIVNVDKLAFLSSFYAVDTGAVNAMVISFGALPLSAYSAGLLFEVKVLVSNTSATTLKVDALAPVTVKKYTATGISDLVTGDLIAGGVYVFEHDGTNFVLLNPTPLPLAQKFTQVDAQTLNTRLGTNWEVTHGFSALPTMVWWRLLCDTGEFNYAAGDELDLVGTMNSAGGGGVDFEPAFAPYTNSNVTGISVASQVSGGLSLQGMDKLTGVDVTLNPAHWRLKVTAILLP